MLKQMLIEDKAESVRQAVARSLAIIVAFIDDEDKFKLVSLHSPHTHTPHTLYFHTFIPPRIHTFTPYSIKPDHLSPSRKLERCPGLINYLTPSPPHLSSLTLSHMQCWELMLKALTDHSQLVVSTTYSVLLPALAAWSFELNTLESDILSYFLHQLLTCIKVRPPSLAVPQS